MIRSCWFRFMACVSIYEKERLCSLKSLSAEERARLLLIIQQESKRSGKRCLGYFVVRDVRKRPPMLKGMSKHLLHDLGIAWDFT